MKIASYLGLGALCCAAPIIGVPLVIWSMLGSLSKVSPSAAGTSPGISTARLARVASRAAREGRRQDWSKMEAYDVVDG